MDQKACLLALRKLILDNEATLVDGLSHQGAARSLKTVTVSVRVPPTAYYHILIQIRRSESRTIPEGGKNRYKATEYSVYHCTIHVSDAAFPQKEETNVFEKMTLDFRTLCDRIESMLRDQMKFSADPPNDSSVFNLMKTSGGTDREIRVTNLDHNWTEAETMMIGSVLYSTIEFVLEERCQK